MDRIAAIVAKHSVQMLMSVTRLRRGHFDWQHVFSISSCQDSGKSSQISTYSFTMILFISFGGTEPKPWSLVSSTAGPLGAVGSVAEAHNAAMSA